MRCSVNDLLSKVQFTLRNGLRLNELHLFVVPSPRHWCRPDGCYYYTIQNGSLPSAQVTLFIAVACFIVLETIPTQTGMVASKRRFKHRYLLDAPSSSVRPRPALNKVSHGSGKSNTFIKHNLYMFSQAFYILFVLYF